MFHFKFLTLLTKLHHCGVFVIVKKINNFCTIKNYSVIDHGVIDSSFYKDLDFCLTLFFGGPLSVSTRVSLAFCGQPGLLYTLIAVASALVATSWLSDLNIMQTYTNNVIHVTKRSLSVT